MTDTFGEPRRMRITGLHHVTLIARNLDATTAFYRDLLGLALVEEAANEDDPDARHFWFGDAEGHAGTLVSFLEYPAMPEGSVGVGSTHHLALAVDVGEGSTWRDYLRSRDVRPPRVFRAWALPLAQHRATPTDTSSSSPRASDLVPHRATFAPSGGRSSRLAASSAARRARSAPSGLRPGQTRRSPRQNEATSPDATLGARDEIETVLIDPQASATARNRPSSRSPSCSATTRR
ncbi:MAG: VOC family protein [Solirubrobacterales bacterium]